MGELGRVAMSLLPPLVKQRPRDIVGVSKKELQGGEADRLGNPIS